MKKLFWVHLMNPFDIRVPPTRVGDPVGESLLEFCDLKLGSHSSLSYPSNIPVCLPERAHGESPDTRESRTQFTGLASSKQERNE